MQKENFIKGLKMFLLVTFGLVAFSFITMHLWNWLMPLIFDLPIITWSQAFGLLVLSKIIFGFSKGNKCCCSFNKNSHSSNLKEKLKKRFENLSDEEKTKMKNKCNSWFDCD